MSIDKVPQDLIDEEPMSMAMYRQLWNQKQRSYYYQIPRRDGTALRVLIRPRDIKYKDRTNTKTNKGTIAKSNPSESLLESRKKQPGLFMDSWRRF